MLDERKDMSPATEINISDARHEIRHCWRVVILDVFGLGDGDDDARPGTSTIELFEDGAPLGPAHAAHDQIRDHGRGLYSHWKGTLYFSSSDNTDPTANGRTYTVRGPFHPEQRAPQTDTDCAQGEAPLFPRVGRVAEDLERASLSGIANAEPAGRDHLSRIRMLEAKVEYLLDEVYELKSRLRVTSLPADIAANVRQHQIDSFDFQWREIRYHPQYLSNPEWRPRATDDVCARVELPPEWFAGKSVLDCGCGPGRHTWAFAKMGADVTAFDASPTAVAEARTECRDFTNVTVEQRSVLEPLPYAKGYYDLVWSYGVLQHTGDMLGGLKNIVSHLRPGGIIYFMNYAEPRRHRINDYLYYHELQVMRKALTTSDFREKAKILAKVGGQAKTLGWFDAVSSEINDLYTIEELYRMLRRLGFDKIKRTMPAESNLNIVATKSGAS